MNYLELKTKLKTMKIDIPAINDHVQKKNISVQKHPTEDLFIYNYSAKVQFNKAWDEHTMQARGLILDGEGKLISLPFKKFFNIGEHDSPSLPDLPTEEFDVYEKMDGSLGISYFIGDKMHLATRGSFTSDQALRGTKILHDKYGDFAKEANPMFTYLFEIIYPENRVVVSYAGVEDIVLLSVVNTQSGEELPHGTIPIKPRTPTKSIKPRFASKFVRPNSFKLEDLANFEESNKEGFVVRFKESGLRVKVKFDEYIRLHRLIFGVNKKTIWDLLRNGDTLGELIEKVPDEFYFWVKKTKKEISESFTALELEAAHVFKEIYYEGNSLSRRELAEAFKNHHKIQAILFAMLDEKDHQPIVWKMVKPKAHLPFKEEI